MKLEKITLWTAIETYGFAKPEPGALDYIIHALQTFDDAEVTVLDYESEDYKLVPVKESDRERKE